jgi:hypothetical protein
LRAIEVHRYNPIHSHPTRVCVSCVTNTGLPKNAHLRRRPAWKADCRRGWFLVWPGGEVVSNTAPPRGQRDGRLHFSRAIQTSLGEQNQASLNKHIHTKTLVPSPIRVQSCRYPQGPPPLTPPPEGGKGWEVSPALQNTLRCLGPGIRRVMLTLGGSRRACGLSRNCGMVPMWPC